MARPPSWMDRMYPRIAGPESRRLLVEAKNHLPQGVAENYRYWGEERTVFIRSAEGCRITDADGKSYVDFRLGYGPIVLGYRDPRVDGAVARMLAEHGTTTGFATPLDHAVVQQVKAFCPQIDKMRFANSGTEAVMGAVRTARGFTGRERIAIVEGGFHGLYDEMMWKSDIEAWDPASGVEPDIIPFGKGIPPRTRGLVDFLVLNDFDGLDAFFAEKGDQLAAVVLEPIMGNCGSISATPAWLTALRDTCHRHGALLIIDEVKTGFRVAPGGAQQRYGIHADLTTYAKAIGNGYPVAAFGGRAEIMDVVGAGGGVVHGGTYTGNMVSLAAAHATLGVMADTPVHETLDRVGNAIMDVLGRVFTAADLPHAFAGPPAMFGVHFTPEVPRDYRSWRKTDSALYARFAWNLIDHGVMLEPDSREPWFLCEAHQDVDLGWLEDVCTRSLRDAMGAAPD
jgi:glutamate-1-semialdehyde 2,1-aminomutase